MNYMKLINNDKPVERASPKYYLRIVQEPLTDIENQYKDIIRAIKGEDKGILRELFEKGYYLEHRDYEIQPIFLAIDPKINYEILTELLKMRADPNIYGTGSKTEYGNLIYTPLIKAAMMRLPHHTLTLLQYGADPNKQDNFGQTPLHYSAIIKDEWIAALLLASGADPTIKNHNGETVIDIVNRRGGLEKLLRKYL